MRAAAAAQREGGPAAAVRKLGSAVNAGFTLVRAQRQEAVQRFLADIVRRGAHAAAPAQARPMPIGARDCRRLPIAPQFLRGNRYLRERWNGPRI